MIRNEWTCSGDRFGIRNDWTCSGDRSWSETKLPTVDKWSWTNGPVVDRAPWSGTKVPAVESGSWSGTNGPAGQIYIAQAYTRKKGNKKCRRCIQDDASRRHVPANCQTCSMQNEALAWACRTRLQARGVIWSSGSTLKWFPIGICGEN